VPRVIAIQYKRIWRCGGKKAVAPPGADRAPPGAEHSVEMNNENHEKITTITANKKRKSALKTVENPSKNLVYNSVEFRQEVMNSDRREPRPEEEIDAGLIFIAFLSELARSSNSRFLNERAPPRPVRSVGPSLYTQLYYHRPIPILFI